MCQHGRSRFVLLVKKVARQVNAGSGEMGAGGRKDKD
jgi:hypothetical protein